MADIKNLINKDREMLAATSNYPLQFASPFYFGFGSTKESLRINNGTITFANFGKGPFGITCWHVIQSYYQKQDEKRLEEKPLLQIGNHSISLAPPLIDKNEDLDLATIKLSMVDIQAIKNSYPGNNVGITQVETSSSIVRIGDFVSFGGFPGEWRRRLENGTLQFSPFKSICNVCSVGENEIICQLDNLSDWHQINVESMPALTNAGGLSGAPAFLMKKLDSGLLYWEFIGVIYEGAFCFGDHLRLHIRLTNCIDEEGYIRNHSR